MPNKKWSWVVIPIGVAVLLIILWLFVLNKPGTEKKPASPFPVDMTTPFGTFALVKAEVGESFPENCTYSNIGPCFLADLDHDVVVLYFQTKDSSDPFTYHNPFFDNATTASITLQDGTKIAGDSGGYYNQQLYLVFYVPKNADDFTFNWYENSSIHFTR